MSDIKEPEPGTWGAVTRSTEEEFQRFRKAMNKLTFTKEEFLQHGPSIIFMKYEECLRILKNEPE